VLGCFVARGDALCGSQLGAVALSIVDREAEALEVLAARPRERRR
jgi:hypothetical protein